MTSVSTGLISGLDTASLIDQLIAVERNPQTLLKNKLTEAKADAAAYRAVNTKFDALRSAAEALTKAPTWGAAKATSSSASVVATAATGATTGSLTFTVDSLAARHTVVGRASWTAPTADLTLTITDGDGDRTPVDVTIGAGASLADAVKAINAADAGVTATMVGSADGYRLQLTATTPGTDGVFTVSDGTGFAVLSQGTDAKLTVGSGDYTFSATSTTNTFSGLVPGVTLTVTAASEEPVTVDVASDPEAITTAVQKLVTAANDALSSIRTQTGTATGSTAALKGDSTLRGLANEVLRAVADAIGDEDSAAQVGIQLDRYGSVVFDATAFTEALTADPTLARRLVDGTGTGTSAVPGVARRLLAVAEEASRSTTGVLVLKAASEDEQASDLQLRIEDWDRRLELRRTTLTAQFTAMETALSSLQNQSSWLASQLKSLPSS
ncbi:hypothetical protein DQ238_10565 [Geodermatophilus sp. TF02-6]|uniref:flagellar filament capping protein FliD n=1 Tax=Geodermatophilus sp. TF02-6 TaxID=2250575 RepID=UPI000DEC018E|nr:flagellar filament capping protein FliD [Geodermatophilus sp. TF02-6]RBY79622.1 hypothetical protein DQ238_10565 [Geodermatophilus sp. TF02-6]